MLLGIGAIAPSTLEARTRKGDKLLKDGRLAEAKRDFDTALELYEQALVTDPQDTGYLLAVRRVRFQAGQAHVDAGMKLREQGKLEEALAEFQRAFATDPSSSIAGAELKRTVEMIEAKKRKETGQPAPAAFGAEAAKRELEERVASIQPVPELKPISRQISTLKMNNQPVKVLFETLGKLAGVNVVWDPEYQSSQKNFSVDFANTSLDQALNHLAVLTKTYWKPLSENTIFLTNDNQTKRRDHEDMVVRTFYLKNLTTPQELQEIATILRSVTDIRRVFTYNAQNIIMVRGTVDQVALAEKLVSDLDKMKGEVVVDVIVMEANRARTRDIAATFLSGNSQGLRVPISFTGGAKAPTTSNSDTTPGTTTTTTTNSATNVLSLNGLSALGSSNNWSIQIPNAVFQALMSDRGTKVLVSPQIRAAHGVKASLKIGDKYPYATGSFQPGVGAVGVSPLVSTQFNFADVGVNVDFTPVVHGADEVTMQVEIDVSNIRDNIDVGGLKQPVIGQRKFSQTIRLKQGEISLVGGLNQNQNTRVLSGTAGLAQIPVLGRLFSGESVERTDGELLIALVPHIVRSPDINDLNLRGIAAGTDTVVRLTMASPSTATAEPPKPAAEPKPEPPKFTAPPPGLPIPGLNVPGAKPPASEAPKPAGALAVRFDQPAASLKAGTPLTLNLQVDNAADLFGAPMRLKWDPKVLRLNDVSRGPLLASDGQQPIFTRNIRNDEGEAVVVLNRAAGAPGVSGSGTLLTLTFQAVGKGSTAVSVLDLALRNAQMQPVAAQPAPAMVNVE